MASPHDAWRRWLFTPMACIILALVAPCATAVGNIPPPSGEQERMDLYEVLSASPDATANELKKAYRRLAARYHPDKCQGEDECAEAGPRMARVNEAYEILSVPERREYYDAYGFADERDVRNWPPAIQLADSPVRVLGTVDETNALAPGHSLWVVDFYMTGCGPCHELVPELKAAAARLAGAVRFGAVDCGVHQEACDKAGVRGFPSLIAFAHSAETGGRVPIPFRHAISDAGGLATDASAIVDWAAGLLPRAALARVDGRGLGGGAAARRVAEATTAGGGMRLVLFNEGTERMERGEVRLTAALLAGTGVAVAEVECEVAQGESGAGGLCARLGLGQRPGAVVFGPGEGQRRDFDGKLVARRVAHWVADLVLTRPPRVATAEALATEARGAAAEGTALLLVGARPDAVSHTEALSLEVVRLAVAIEAARLRARAAGSTPPPRAAVAECGSLAEAHANESALVAQGLGIGAIEWAALCGADAAAVPGAVLGVPSAQGGSGQWAWVPAGGGGAGMDALAGEGRRRRSASQALSARSAADGMLAWAEDAARAAPALTVARHPSQVPEGDWSDEEAAQGADAAQGQAGLATFALLSLGAGCAGCAEAEATLLRAAIAREEQRQRGKRGPKAGLLLVTCDASPALAQACARELRGAGVEASKGLSLTSTFPHAIVYAHGGKAHLRSSGPPWSAAGVWSFVAGALESRVVPLGTTAAVDRFVAGRGPSGGSAGAPREGGGVFVLFTAAGSMCPMCGSVEEPLIAASKALARAGYPLGRARCDGPAAGACRREVSRGLPHLAFFPAGSAREASEGVRARGVGYEEFHFAGHRALEAPRLLDFARGGWRPPRLIPVGGPSSVPNLFSALIQPSTRGACADHAPVRCFARGKAACGEGANPAQLAECASTCGVCAAGRSTTWVVTYTSRAPWCGPCTGFRHITGKASALVRRALRAGGHDADTVQFAEVECQDTDGTGGGPRGSRGAPGQGMLACQAAGVRGIPVLRIVPAGASADEALRDARFEIQLDSAPTPDDVAHFVLWMHANDKDKAKRLLDEAAEAARAETAEADVEEAADNDEEEALPATESAVAPRGGGSEVAASVAPPSEHKARAPPSAAHPTQPAAAQVEATRAARGAPTVRPRQQPRQPPQRPKAPLEAPLAYGEQPSTMEQLARLPSKTLLELLRGAGGGDCQGCTEKEELVRMTAAALGVGVSATTTRPDAVIDEARSGGDTDSLSGVAGSAADGRDEL